MKKYPEVVDTQVWTIVDNVDKCVDIRGKDVQEKNRKKSVDK